MEDEYLSSGRAVALDLSLERLAGLFEGTWKWGIGGIPRADGKGWVVTPTICSDGPSGLRTERGKAVLPSVLYPCPAAMASTWDRELETRLGAAMARDARIRGVDLILAPGVNIKRDPRCGRNFEYLSEDPLLSGRMGAAFVRGAQSQGVGACVKHYLCNSQETERFTFDAHPSVTVLMDLYYPAFERVVLESDPWCVMLAYNRYAGVPCTADESIISLLVDRTGYEGCFISDWGAVSDPIFCLEAGLNVCMPGLGGDIKDVMLPALKENLSLQSKVRDSAARVLGLNFRAEAGREVEQLGRLSDSLDVALEAARKSIVLLKNEGVLPVLTSEPVAIIGDRASRPLLQGYGSSRVTDIDRERLSPVGEFSSRHRSLFSQGYRLNEEPDERLEKEAVECAEKAGLAIVFLGLEDYQDGEGADRRDILLPENQIRLARRIIESSARAIFVIQAGSAVDLSCLDGADAILYQYMGGRSMALAITEVLLGLVNPSGHLAETLPLSEEVPLGDSFPVVGRPDLYPEGELVGYRWYDTFERPVSYPFGYGLSYSSFRYLNTRITSDVLDSEKGVTIELDIENESDWDGAQVIQVYLRPEIRFADRPVHWLAGFERVEVPAGESRTVPIHIPAREFMLWNSEREDYSLAEGRFLVEVAISSRDMIASLPITVEHGEGTWRFPQAGKRLERPVFNLNPAPDEAVGPTGEYTRESRLVDVFNSRGLLRKLMPLLIYGTKKSLGITDGKLGASARRYLESNLEYPMRFASIAGLSSRMVDGLLAIANRHLFRGLWMVLSGSGNRQRRAEKGAYKLSKYRKKRG